jgi:hypothetical protein
MELYSLFIYTPSEKLIKEKIKSVTLKPNPGEVQQPDHIFVGKRYLQVQQLTKPQMAKSMMARAIRGSPLVILVGGTSNIIPLRRPSLKILET